MTVYIDIFRIFEIQLKKCEIEEEKVRYVQRNIFLKKFYAFGI